MGLYPIPCAVCKKGFLWWSGTMDQRCPDCQKKGDGPWTAKDQDEFLDQIDKIVNKTLFACGHEPCTLGHCKNCKQHCRKKKEKTK